jgi:hypothetical protein
VSYGEVCKVVDVAHLRAAAEQDAAYMLAAYWDEDYYPVDPYAIAQACGIDAFVGDLPDDLSGMLRVDGGKVSMYVDTDDHPRRQRFTAAHELGHYFRCKEDGRLTEDAAFVERRGWAARNGSDPDEIYANAFGAALLMPRPVVELLRSRGLNAYDMARFFDVSASAMSFRITNLGLS